VAAVGGIPLIFIVLPIAVVIGLKMRRRRTRMSSDNLVSRVAGGWAEIIDRARDLGKSPTPSATRTEQAELLVSLYSRLTEKADPRILARQADMTVFAPDTITPGQASTYWATVDDAVGGLEPVGLSAQSHPRIAVGPLVPPLPLTSANRTITHKEGATWRQTRRCLRG